MDIQEVKVLLEDKSFRSNIIRDANKYAADLGYKSKVPVEYKAVKNTKNITYIAFPSSIKVTMESLANVSAAGAFTLGSAGSLGTACTCVSTLGTASSALVANVGGETYDLTNAKF